MINLSGFSIVNLLIFAHSAIDLTNGYVDVLFTSDAYSPPTLIETHGYPMENYIVLTSDAYMLELHRIPRGVKSPKGNNFPVLFLHGFLDSSFGWIANGPNRSLAYLLADQGYDSWMINFRGNTFSEKHVNYTSDEPKFWDFSVHEMGIHDLPTAIDFILNKTNHTKVLCIGHSIGNSQFYLMLSELPQYNDKIIAQVCLAPFYHSEMPTRELRANLLALIAPIISKLKPMGPFSQRNLATKLLIQTATALQLYPDGYTLYDFILYLSDGLKRDHVNREIMPAVYNNVPAGTSLKAVQHAIQFFKSFSFFDYGPEENVKIYGTPFSPKYNINHTRIPVRIYYAKQDLAGNPTEVDILYDQLPNKAGIIEISDHNYSHFDFLYNRNNNELLNKDVLDFVNNITKNTS